MSTNSKEWSTSDIKAAEFNIEKGEWEVNYFGKLILNLRKNLCLNMDHCIMETKKAFCSIDCMLSFLNDRDVMLSLLTPLVSGSMKEIEQ